MKIDTLIRAAQILRCEPAYTMSLRDLHARLFRELGSQMGTYADVYQQFKNHPDSFLLIDSPRLLPDGGQWPQHLRDEYDSALQDAGLGSCVRVALAEFPEESSHDDALAAASATVSELWIAAAKDTMLRDFATRAAQQLAEISIMLAADAEEAHPTTHPRDPRR